MSTGLYSMWAAAVSVAVGYVIICPFTKVEESFNLQAIHDHIYYGLDVHKFDHNEFPGVVPRTFVGSMLIGYLCNPLMYLNDVMPKLCIQYAARIVLCAVVMTAYLHFLVSVRKLYGSSVAFWSCLLTITQFHFLYYSSRPLPNTFAVIFALLACSYWLRNQQRKFVFLSGWTIIVFRSELATMFGIMLLITLMYGKLPLWKCALWILFAGAASLGATVLIDSFFWQRWVWPEGEAFYFNAVLNKSSEWGTSPFLWYFYSALPRAMGLSLLIVPLGLKMDRRCFVMAVPAFGFVLIYSILPHKELRFILYVVPILNVVAARACSALWNNRNKGASRKLASLLIIGHLLLNMIMTAFLLNVSFHNYPGGKALQHLNDFRAQNQKLHIHIDVYSAQTGVSRFLNEHPSWKYDKTESSEVVNSMLSTYTHLLMGTPDEKSTKAKISNLSDTHKVIHTEKCFKNIQVAKQYPFVKIRLAPCVWLLERK